MNAVVVAAAYERIPFRVHTQLTQIIQIESEYHCCLFPTLDLEIDFDLEFVARGPIDFIRTVCGLINDTAISV